MAAEEIATYLKYANLQMAAEAFFDRPGTMVERLVYGNGHPSRFPALVAEEFAKDWKVVDQKANTESGFSGTLFAAIPGTVYKTNKPFPIRPQRSAGHRESSPV